MNGTALVWSKKVAAWISSSSLRCLRRYDPTLKCRVSWPSLQHACIHHVVAGIIGALDCDCRCWWQWLLE